MTWTLSAFADEAAPATDDQIAALKRGRISRIDPRSLEGHNIVDLPLEKATAAQKRFEQAGITVNMFGSPIGKLDITEDLAKDLARLEHLGRLKDIFHCNTVRIFSYYNKSHLPHDQWQAQSLDRLKRLIDLADRLGLVLYHENESHIFGDRSDDVLKIAELRNGSSFKLIYDFANYVRTGEDGLEIWAKLADKTDYFHFKDQRKTGEHVPMGQGDSHARQILKAAAASGWTGGCTLEPHLFHSKAVLATNVEGSASKSLADLGPGQCFQVAAAAANALLSELGVA